jgi:O-antigen/teichoic acid export membrane protein
MGLIKWSGQIVAWVSTLVVARLLTPSDYGLVGMATLYLGFLTILSEFGIGAAIVVLRELTQHQIRQINTVSVIFGAAGYIVSCALAKPIGDFFNAPELPLVIIVLSSTFLIASFRSVPWALLQRDMRFKRIAAFEGAQAIALAIISVVLAALGFRYWTLVTAAVLSSLIATGFALTLHSVGFARPRWHELRRALIFSKEVILQRISWFTYSNADFFVAARIVGQSAYGAYTVGWTLANTPIDKIGTLVLQVTPAVFSAVQDNREALARYVVAITEAIACVLFPLLVGMAIVAPEFVPIVLGEQWTSMIVPLQLLSLYSCFRAIMPLLTQVLMVTGDERFAARNMMLAAVIMPIAFFIGGWYWGLTGIAWAWILVHPIIAYRVCHVALRNLGIGMTDFLVRPLWPAVSSCIAMMLAVTAVRIAMPDTWTSIIRLILEVAIGGIAYCTTLLVFHRDRVLKLKQVVANLRGAGT